MSGTQWMLDRLFGRPAARDGGSPMLEKQAEAAEDPSPAPATPASRRARASLQPQRIVSESLAAKVLHGWLQNRHQTLYPLTLNFRALDESGRALLVRIMAAAAAADGTAGEAEREPILRALDLLGAGEAERHLLLQVLTEPQPIGALLQEVQEAQLGAHAYAASLLAVDRRSHVNRAWLDYIAARFALPAEITKGLDRRYAG